MSIDTEKGTEPADLFMHRLQKSLVRQAWMREAYDLLAKRGVVGGVAEARQAFTDGLTPTEFATRYFGSAK